jgi:SAM-dependent methyltransferase
MYTDLAWAWPLIAPIDDFFDESEEIAELIRKHSMIEARTILHLGCGGGHNDHFLKKSFEVTGVDLNDSMLELAGKLNPEVRYLVGDMRDIRLGELFDAVLIQDSIAYMTSEDELRQAFSTAYEHLKPGGVFVTFAEDTKESFRQNETIVETGRRGDTEVVLVENTYDPDPSDTTAETVMVFLIRRAGKLQIETETHIGGLFSIETWKKLLNQVGYQLVDAVASGSDRPGEFGQTLVCVKPRK